MLSRAFLYLAEASFCLVVFALAYRWLLAGLTYFAWNRAYLLGALAAGLALPFAAFPGLAGWLSEAAVPGAPLPLRLAWRAAPAAAPAHGPASTAPDAAALVLAALAMVYALGALSRLFGAARNLYGLNRLARRHPRTDHGPFAVVHLPAPGLPAFSFGRFVFLSPQHQALTEAERQLLLLHEAVHVRQRHTLDLLLVEALGVVFWFNGAVPYFGQQLKAVHEYLADEAVARTQASPARYGELLIKLAAQQPPFALVHAFSNKQIFLRIRMLTQPASAPVQKLRFLLVLPVLAFAWAATACAGAPAPDAAAPAAPAAAPAAAGAGRIGRITWQGNAYLSTAELNQALGLRPGDVYDSAAVARRLGPGPNGGDVTLRYLDHGYLFFALTPSAQRRPDGTTDLTFAVSEGRKSQLGTVTIRGNKTTATAALLRRLPLRTGEDFSRAKLLETQRILARQGQFEPAKIGINPRPVMRPQQPTDLVDLEIVVVEKAKP